MLRSWIGRFVCAARRKFLVHRERRKLQERNILHLLQGEQKGDEFNESKRYPYEHIHISAIGD